MVVGFSFSQNPIIIVFHQGNQVTGSEVSKQFITGNQLTCLNGYDFLGQNLTTNKLKYDVPEIACVISKKNRLRYSKESILLFDTLKFIPTGKSYMYNGEIIKANKMYKIMLSKNDPDLHKMVKKAKIARGVQYAGFAGIYLGVGSIAAFALSAILRSTQDNNIVQFNGNPDLYFAQGIVYGTVALALGTTGIVFHIRHKKLKARAVSFYNEKY